MKLNICPKCQTKNYTKKCYKCGFDIEKYIYMDEDILVTKKIEKKPFYLNIETKEEKNSTAMNAIAISLMIIAGIAIIMLVSIIVAGYQKQKEDEMLMNMVKEEQRKAEIEIDKMTKKFEALNHDSLKNLNNITSNMMNNIPQIPNYKTKEELIKERNEKARKMNEIRQEEAKRRMKEELNK